MQTLRTPDDSFSQLSDFSLQPQYRTLDSGDGGELRVAFTECGPESGRPIVLLHGEPSWSYLYRHVAPPLADAGFRVVLPDLVGFGRSDKPALIEDHSFARHVEWMRALLFDELSLNDLNIFGQDWGGLIGMRLVAEQPDRFASMMWANTGLPTGDQKMPELWLRFREAVKTAETLDIARLIQSGCLRALSDGELAAYDAPYPDESFKAGPRAMPTLVPTRPDDPASEANRQAWDKLGSLEIPALIAFSDSDPITGDMAPILAKALPGAAGGENPTITGAGHFLQEDNPSDLSAAIINFLA